MDPMSLLSQITSGGMSTSSMLGMLSGGGGTSGSSGGMSPTTALSTYATIRGMTNNGSSNPFIFGGRVIETGLCDTNPAKPIYPPPTYIENVTRTPYFVIAPCAGGDSTVGGASITGYIIGNAPMGLNVLGTYTPGGQTCTDNSVIATPSVSLHIGKMSTIQVGSTCGVAAAGTAAGAAGTLASGSQGTGASGAAGTGASGAAGTGASGAAGTQASGAAGTDASGNASISTSLYGNNNANDNTGIDGQPLYGADSNPTWNGYGTDQQNTNSANGWNGTAQGQSTSSSLTDWNSGGRTAPNYSTYPDEVNADGTINNNTYVWDGYGWVIQLLF
jgi:hypothetical protein